MNPSFLHASGLDLATENHRLESAKAEERIAWAVGTFGERLVLSSSFGAQAAVALHLVTRIVPRIPVILVDTGYLFPETYRFIDELTEKLQLNLKIYRPPLTPAQFETKYGKLWEEGVEGITEYNRIMKVEPMQRGLAELDPSGWLAGLRRQQSKSRRELGVLAEQGGRLKIHPIIDWTDRDVHRYLTTHGLPYHPLWEEGYVSIGDVHSTRPLTAGMVEEDTRFGGLKRECGLHVPSKAS